jgi:hypothetical protein
MKPDYWPLEVLCLVAVVFIVALVVLLRVRAGRERKPWMPGLNAAEHRSIHGGCKCFGCESRGGSRK